MSDNFWWTGATALGTWIAAGIVGWYAWETKKLRGVAQEQLEASMAPLLLLSKHPPTSFPQVRATDFAHGEKLFNFAIYNAGKGAALQGRLRARSGLLDGGEHPGLSPSIPRPEGYDLSAIPAGTAIQVSLKEETLVGIAATDDAIEKMWLEFEILYESASGRRYRTYVKAEGRAFDEPKVVEYGLLKG